MKHTYWHEHDYGAHIRGAQVKTFDFGSLKSEGK
jgi:hypothetical protein